jgi:hypothetical protein
VPVVQLALNVVDWPSQIEAGVAATAVGVGGVGVTVTKTGEEALLQTPFTHAE